MQILASLWESSDFEIQNILHTFANAFRSNQNRLNFQLFFNLKTFAK